MTLDQRADAAVRELLAATATDVDVSRRLADLRATRRRRDTGRVASLAVAAAALVGATAWVATHVGDEDTIQPAPAPHQVRNGALVALPDVSDAIGGWRVVQGPDVEHLPDPLTNGTDLQFTPDGRQAVYVDTRGKVQVLDVDSGGTRVIGTCPDQVCLPALSPDGTTLAWSGPPGLRLQEVGQDALRTIPSTEEVDGAGWPSWSPDGSRIAFIAPDGVYLVRPDGSDLRRVHPLPGRTAVWRPVTFSPDGSRIAFLEGVPRDGGDDDELDWTVVNMAVDGSDEQRFFDAGSCPCGGQPVPAIAWSPDGRYLAVTVRHNGPSAGLHVMRPDGTDDRLVVFNYFVSVAWQPLVE